MGRVSELEVERSDLKRKVQVLEEIEEPMLKYHLGNGISPTVRVAKQGGETYKSFR